jgi:hypothetical protein
MLGAGPGASSAVVGLGLVTAHALRVMTMDPMTRLDCGSRRSPPGPLEQPSV